MAKLNVINDKAEVLTEVELSNDIFGIKPNKQAIFDSIISERAAQRQGTKRTKTKGEVSGGGKKPWAQKHTGKARQGSIRSPQWRGGGIVFGPTGMENYKLKMNKKVYKLAVKSALSQKFIANEIVVLDALKFTKPSTTKLVGLIKTLEIKGKLLFVLKDLKNKSDSNILMSARNIERVNVKSIKQISVEDIIGAKRVIFTQDAINAIQEVL